MRSLDSKPPRSALGAFVLLHLPPPGQPGSDPTPQTEAGSTPPVPSSGDPHFTAPWMPRRRPGLSVLGWGPETAPPPTRGPTP